MWRRSTRRRRKLRPGLQTRGLPRSPNLRGTCPDRSLLLAVEALKVENTLEARGSLFKALRARPGLRSFLHTAEGDVSSVAFSPDGKTLAAGYGVLGDVCGVVLWEVATRKRLLEDPLPVEGGVHSMAFSPDGKTLAVGHGVRGGGGAGVVLWDFTLNPGSATPAIANRNFTQAEWDEYFPNRPYGPTFCNLPVPPEQPAGRTTTRSPSGSKEPAKDDRR